MGEIGCLWIFYFLFFWPLPHVSGTSPWLLRPVRVSISSELYCNTWLFFECLGIQFFNSLTCDLQDTMPHQSSPTLIPREAENFFRGDNHSKHVPLPTYLAWLQPFYYNSRLVFILAKTAKILLVVKTLIKKHRVAVKLISSSHESKKMIINAPSKNALQGIGNFLKWLPQEIHFRTWMCFKIASSKNTFQNMGDF